MPAVRINVRQAEDSRDIVHQAVQALAEGHLVAFPTETLYGVAASALHEPAVARLRAWKGAVEAAPFALAVKGAEDVLDYAPNMTDLARRLARRCWPGPLTMLLNDSHPDGVTQRLPGGVRAALASAPELAFRVPAHPIIESVLRLSAGPLALTGAQLPGQPLAVTADDAIRALEHQAALVLDDGPSKFGQPSTIARVDEHGLKVTREGVFNEKSLRRMSSLMVVFVCTGNTCRSPMASSLLKAKLAQRLGCEAARLEDRGVLVASAGIAAMSGQRAAAEAIATMKQRNIDLQDHESQPLSERLVRFADLVLTMTRGHRDAICAQWPESAERVHQLCQGDADVHDPIGGPAEVYQACADQIDAELEAWIRRLDLERLVPSETGE